MKRYVYLVVYRSLSYTGNVEVFMAEPIEYQQQIASIEVGIQHINNVKDRPVVTNFILLREDDEGIEDAMIFLKDCHNDNS